MAEQEKDGPVGLIGIGNMGAPMARCLGRAGWRVLGWDVNGDARAMLAGEPWFAAAENAGAVGAACRTVIAMLPDGAVVREAAMGAGGLAGAMGEGATLVDMSSSDPLGTQALGADLAERRIALVDAPVSGGVTRAKSGTLAIMAGGEASAIDRVEPMLSSMGTVLRTGPLGSGHAMKALNNYVSVAGLAAACEALLVGRRFGLDPEVVTDVLNASTGRNNATENKLKQFVVNRAFNAGFTLDLMVKDVNTARDLARGLDVPAPGLEEASALLACALEALGKGADHTALYAYLESLGERGGQPGKEEAAQ